MDALGTGWVLVGTAVKTVVGTAVDTAGALLKTAAFEAVAAA